MKFYLLAVVFYVPAWLFYFTVASNRSHNKPTLKLLVKGLKEIDEQNA